MNTLRTIENVGLPCAKCAVKHLYSAASYASVNGVTPGDMVLYGPEAAVSRAVVAYTEYRQGYLYHKGYVIGCLVQAEDGLAGDGEPERSAALRGIRLAFDDSDTLDVLTLRTAFGASYVTGHVLEALREAPEEFKARVASLVDITDGGWYHSFVSRAVALAETISETVFRNPPEEPEKGGEMDMACAKKGKCAAQKGGKTMQAKKAAGTIKRIKLEGKK